MNRGGIAPSKLMLIALVTAAGGGAFYYYYFHKRGTRAVAMETRRRRNPGRARRRVAMEQGLDDGEHAEVETNYSATVHPTTVRALPGGDEPMDAVPPLTSDTGVGMHLNDLRTRNFEVGMHAMQGGKAGTPNIVPRAAHDSTPLPTAAIVPTTHSSLYSAHPIGPSTISPPVLTKCYTPFAENCASRPCGVDPSAGTPWPEPMSVHGKSRCERRVNPIAPFNAAQLQRERAGKPNAGGYFHLSNDALSQTITHVDELPSDVSAGRLPGME